MNSLSVHASQTLTIGLAQSLVSGLGEGLVLALAVWVGLKLIPRTSASTRFASWLIAFLAVAALPLASVIPQHGAMVSGVAPAGAALPHVTLDPRWALAVGFAWLLGSLGRFGSLVWNGYRLRKLWKFSRAVPVPSPEIALALAESTSRRLELRVSGLVGAPCAIGLFRPAILIPEWLWAKLDSAELRQIVLHEAAHLGRFDDWTNLLQKLILVVFPLNPALVWIERRLCLEREMACDDAVLNAAVSARDYATCLTGLAERKLLRQTASLAPGAWSRRSELVRRVQGILSKDRNASPIVAKGVAAACLATTLGGAVALSRTPQIVSFAAPVTVAQGADMVFPATPELRTAARPQVVSYHPSGGNLPVTHPAAFAPRPIHQTVRQTPASVTPETVARVNTPPTPALETEAPEVRQELRQVGILQSRITGQSWIVLSVWRSTPAAPGRAPVSNSEQPPQPAASQPVMHIQTGWILIQI